MNYVHVSMQLYPKMGWGKNTCRRFWGKRENDEVRLAENATSGKVRRG